MYNFFQKEISIIEKHETIEKKYNHSIALVRALSQIVAISLLHICNEEINEDIYFENFSELLLRLNNPSDSLPFEIIEKSIFLIKDYTQYQDILDRWYKKCDDGKTLSIKSQEFIKGRNTSSHTIIDTKTSHIEYHNIIIFLKDFIESSINLLPILDDARLIIIFHGKKIDYTLPIFQKNKPCIIRKIHSNKGVFLIQLKTLDIESSEELKVEIKNKKIIENINNIKKSHFEFCTIEKNKKPFTLIHNIPSRQTLTFNGREEELNQIKEWISDIENRVLMIYGDGGFGKTTLLLEFLNRVIDGDIDCPENFPDFICFYSSKMTKWGENGLIYIKGVSESISDGIKKPLYLFSDKLDKSIHTMESLPLIEKVSQELSEQGFAKEKVVLIFDNTETLTTTTEGAKELGEILKKVSRKIGKIIITTRRREITSADSIELSGLNEEDAIQLLKKLAENYSINQIKNSSESRLRNISKKLSYKPILLETFAKHLSRTNNGLDETLEQIYTKNNHDLLEFLYEDAWNRISSSERKILLSISLCLYPITESSLAEACRIFEKPVSDFDKVLDETYFTNTFQDTSERIIEIIPQAKNFFEIKISTLPTDIKDSIKFAASTIDQQSQEEERIKREYYSQTNTDAHRNFFAKAGKIELDKGKIDSANTNYQLALEEDPLNASLHEFYARFALNHLRNKELAAVHIDKALEIEDSDPNFLFTKGMIFYRSDKIEEGDHFLNASLKNGRNHLSIYIEKSIARFHFIRKNLSDKKTKKYFTEANDYIEEALKIIPRSRNKYTKINHEKAIKTQKQLNEIKNKIIYRKNYVI